MFACVLLRRILGALLACALTVFGWLLLAPASPVAAATTYYVGDTGDGTTTTGCAIPTNTTCTLRGAISVATSGSDTITFTNAAFPANTPNMITLTSATALTLGTSVTIDGTGHSVTVDGGCTDSCGTPSASGGVTVFGVNTGVTANLTALKIQHGNTGGSGGGIFNSGTLALTNSTLSSNSATSNGGGIYSNGTVTLTNSNLFSNSASNGGGGIDNFFGALTVTNSFLAFNFTNTATSGGGGILNNGGTTIVTNTALYNNAATADAGGGIFNTNNGTVTVTNSTLSGNSAGNGGGVYANGGTLKVTNSTFSGNSAFNGGGILSNGSTATVTSSTFSGNFATTGGSGGGIYVYTGTVTLTNTIVALNTVSGAGSSCPDLCNTFTSGGHNLIGTTSGSTGIMNGTNSDIVNPNPLLGTLSSNGGSTQTIPLLPGSPAINAGGAVGSGPAGNTVPALDQRGKARVGTPDIGAFEVQSTTLVVNNTSDGTADTASCETGNANLCRLRDAIAAVAAGNNTITFDAAVFPANTPTPITLSSGTLTLAANATIDGTGHRVIVDGGCTFSGGACMGVTGARVFTVNSGVTATLTALTIQHGNGNTGGSGILNNGGTVTVTNSTLTANSTPGNGNSGGGITNNGGTLTVTNSTFSGNSLVGGSNNGGGIFNNGPLTVTNSTFSGNAATNGGGIFNYSGTARLTNTIVAGNTASNGPDLYNTFTSGGHNLVGDTSGSTGITNGANGDIVNPNPGLGPLSSNGGPSQTIPLLAGSPAIAHGDPAVCNQVGAGKVGSVDQRGVTRPTTLCAIGAFEPLLSAISLSSGSIGGGMTVTLTGAGFAAGATVSIGGVNCANVQIVNSTTLRCTTGAHAAGAVDVVVTVGSATGTLTGGYTYGVVTPLPGPLPPGGAAGSPNALPVSRPSGSTGGPAPNPLPAPRP